MLCLIKFLAVEGIMVVIGRITAVAITTREEARPLTMAGRPMALSAIHLPVWMPIVSVALPLALSLGRLAVREVALAVQPQELLSVLWAGLMVVSIRAMAVVAERVAIAAVVEVQVTAVAGNVIHG
ncbi:Uncharacterised protein [Serratia fonticola]|jgi:hypothetical protein|nr:Uncharacterised protein [Serratia fonticola]CAI1680623.1 Uncharacterised protein [Serratia fonticola]